MNARARRSVAAAARVAAIGFAAACCIVAVHHAHQPQVRLLHMSESIFMFCGVFLALLWLCAYSLSLFEAYAEADTQSARHQGIACC